LQPGPITRPFRDLLAAAARGIERDLEELERLRKLDEARRREEAGRQRRQPEQAPLPASVPVAPTARPATPG
jgi:hypothetical protein